MNTAADANMIQHNTANAKRISVKIPGAIRSTAIALTAAMILSACGGGGGGGSSHHAAPNVSASVIGQNAPGAGNTYTVRAGSEVLLSGKDSEGTDAPILSFAWRQVSPTASDQQIPLTERTTSSKIFTAPAVATETTYVFELTGTDANGQSSKQQVSVKVEPILDSNLFLIQPGTTEQLNILVQRANPCSGNSCAQAVPFTLTLSQVAIWGDRADPAVTHGPYTLPLKTLANRQIDAGQRSTVISIPLPKLIIDDINHNLEVANLRDQRIELDRVNTVNAALEFALTPGTAENISLDLVKDDKTTPVGASTSSLTDPNAASAAFSVSYDLTDIRDKLGLSSATTGSAYYSAIDPTAKYAKLSAWLFDAGFTDASGKLKNDSSITKAIYVNNFDLGFGREMYMRKDGSGNVFSYVINYPSLENAIQGSNAFAVVAMEYSGYPSGTPSGCTKDKFVKFFAFVPDQANGGFKRMPTMNFDGRGEKAVPGVCTACHGGSLNLPYNTGETFANVNSVTKCGYADVDATFMPWDLDSFLYTDTDPSLNRTNITDVQYAQYTRSAQQNQLRALNEGALATYVNNPARYDASVRLIHGWYGDTDLPASPIPADQVQLPASAMAHTFDGSYVQSGWSSQPDLYQNVFARHCRACHTQRDPGKPTDIPYPAKKVFSSYNDFISYTQTSDGRIRSYVFELGVMPDARLTMDRFWVPANAGADSAAETLRKHLQDIAGVTITTTPGQPIAHFTPSTNTPDFGTQVSLDGSSSLFADTYQWTVAVSNTGGAADCSTTASNATSSQSFFTVNQPKCQYEASLIVSNSLTGQISAAEKNSIIVNNTTPHTINMSYSVEEGQTIDINILSDLKQRCSNPGTYCPNIFGDTSTSNLPAVTISPITTSQYAVTDLGSGVAHFQSKAAAGPDPQPTFNYQITDSFGESAPVAGVITVTINSAGALQAVDHNIGSVSAWNSANQGANSFNVSDLLTGASGGVGALAVTSVQTIPGTTKGTVSLNGNQFTYTPAARFIGQDTFSYSIADSSTVNPQSIDRMITVNVTTTHTYQQLKADVFNTATCSTGGCHAPVGAQPNWNIYANVIARVVCGPTSTDIETSHILSYPTDGFGTMSSQITLHDTTYNKIFYWIQEGARDNSNADGGISGSALCPP